MKTRLNKSIRIVQVLNRFAPYVTIVVMVMMPLVLPTYARLADAGAGWRNVVKHAVDEAPYLISDRWAGQSVKVTPAARQMLRPNAILSRRFSRIDSNLSVSLLFVHCMDARDMQGHYPPICYPSAGWSQGPVDDAQIDLGCRSLPVRLYTFTRNEQQRDGAGLRVLNFFVLPSGKVTLRQQDIRDQAERRAVSALGVGQFHVVAPTGVGDQKLIDAAGEILQGMPDLLDAIGLCGDGEESDAE